uniref:hypothetical protein n=1 Tax=Chitinimonas sp. TaxID=1934313 RepID=UPI0035B2532C
DIVQFNNSQNSVKIWSVRSVDDTQERLRSDFEKYAIQYTPKQEGSKKKKDGQKIIELDKLTQFLASGRSEYLIQAINAKTELFDQPYQNLFTHDIKAEVIYLYWRMGMIADRLRQDRLAQLKEEDTDKVSSALLGVSGTYWIVYCTNKLVSSENKTIAAQLRLDKQKGDDFEGALEKYVAHALDMYFDVAIDTYDDETYGSVRSALRSPRFLQKFDQKLNNKLASKVKSIKLPSLSHAIKSAKAD